jgi:hypothetical protein
MRRRAVTERELVHIRDRILAAMGRPSTDQEAAGREVDEWISRLIPQIIAQRGRKAEDKEARQCLAAVTCAVAAERAERRATSPYEKSRAESTGQNFMFRIDKLADRIEKGWMDRNWFLGFMRSYCEWERVETLRQTALEQKTSSADGLLPVCDVLDIEETFDRDEEGRFQEVMCSLKGLYHALTADQFSALLLRHCLGLKAESVAAIMGKSEDAVRKLVEEAKPTLDYFWRRESQ